MFCGAYRPEILNRHFNCTVLSSFSLDSFFNPQLLWIKKQGASGIGWVAVFTKDNSFVSHLLIKGLKMVRVNVACPQSSPEKRAWGTRLVLTGAGLVLVQPRRLPTSLVGVGVAWGWVLFSGEEFGAELEVLGSKVENKVSNLKFCQGIDRVGLWEVVLGGTIAILRVHASTKRPKPLPQRDGRLRTTKKLTYTLQPW